MKKTASQNLRLGIFVVLGTALFVAGTYMIGNQDALFGNALRLSATFKNVNGLKNGNNIRFSGVNVGRVGDIEIINDSMVRVHMVLDGDMTRHIRKNAIATIGSDGLVGSMIVNIIPGNGTAGFVQSGDAIESYSRIAAEDLLSTLNVTNENAALLTADMLEITQSILDGKGTLGRLLTDTAMAADLQQTIANLKRASDLANQSIVHLNAMVASINFEESMAGLILTDTASARQIRSIINHLETASINIETTAENLESLIGDVREGKGTVGYLATDSALVRRLESTMKHVEEGSERFNENMEALKHNFLFRKYFRKKEQDSRKAAKKASKAN